MGVFTFWGGKLNLAQIECLFVYAHLPRMEKPTNFPTQKLAVSVSHFSQTNFPPFLLSSSSSSLPSWVRILILPITCWVTMVTLFNLLVSISFCLKWWFPLTILFFEKIYLFIWEGERLRERENMQVVEGWGQKERERIPSRLNTEPAPNTGLNLPTLRSWPELKSKVQLLTNWAAAIPRLLF